MPKKLDLEPLDLEPIEDQAPPEVLPEPGSDSSFLGSMWDYLYNQPLTDLPSRAGKAVSEYIDPERGTTGLRSYGSAFAESVGDVLSGLTTPLNLLTGGAFGGAGLAAKRGLPYAAKGLSRLGQGLSVPVALHGAGQIVSGETPSEKVAGGIELLGGGLGVKSAIPKRAGFKVPKPSFADEVIPPVAGATKKLDLAPIVDDIPPEWPLSDTHKRIDELYGKIGNGTATKSEMLEAERLVDQVAGPSLSKTDMVTHDKSSITDPEMLDTLKKFGLEDVNKPVVNEMPKPAVKPIEQRVVYDAAGNKRVLSEIDAVDYEVQPGETYGIERGDRFIKLQDAGGVVPEELKVTRVRRREYPGLVKPKITTDKTLAADLEASLAQSGGNKPPIPPSGNLVDDIDPNIPIEPRTPQDFGPNSTFHEIYNLPRGMMSVDLPFMTSAAFRQASPLAWTGNWFKAWSQAAKAYGSENAHKAINANIQQSKYFKPRYEPITDSSGNIIKYKEKPSFAEEAGVKMSDLNHLTTREESIASTWSEKIPIYGKAVRASNRAYTSFLNDLRKNTFEKLMSELPDNNMELAKEVAQFINNATGRGQLKFSGPSGRVLNLEQSATALNNALFSPRLLASRINFLNPYTYTQAPPEVRKEYLKGILRVAGTWGTFAGLAEMGGAAVGKDPNSSDFGKIKIGNTRLDPGSGFQQVLVLMSRMRPESLGGGFSSTSGRTGGYKGGPFKRTRLTTAQEFAASKLHPSAKFVYDMMNATSDRPFDVTEEVVQRAMPMMVTDLFEAASDDPELAALIVPLSSVGIGTQTFEPGRYDSPVYSGFAEEVLGIPSLKYEGR